MSDAKRRPSGMSLLARAVALALAAALFVDRSAALSELTPRIGDMRFNIMQVFVFWSDFLAAGFYICALWGMGVVFSRLNRGDPFGPALVRGMRESGLWLAAGALSALLFAPNLAHYAGVPAEPDSLELRVVHMTFLFIGIAFLSLARRGAQLKSELEEFV